MSQLINVRYSDILRCYVVESPHHKVYVKLRWWENLWGITLKEKLDKAILKVFENEMALINAKITAKKLSGV